MPFLFFSPGYLVLVLLPTLVIGGLAAFIVKSTFARYSRIGNRRGLTGAQAANEMLRRYGVTNVGIERVPGRLSDHYDPRSKTLRLSEGVYDSQSLAAIGVACHEAGHALQHARSFTPLYLRSALVPVTNLCTSLYIIPIILAGVMIPLTGHFSPTLAAIGVAMCGMGLLFSLVTLPVEYDASRRAKIAMRDIQLLAPEERVAAGRVLNAAFLTYVAAVVTSLLVVLYWAWRLGLLGGRR